MNEYEREQEQVHEAGDEREGAPGPEAGRGRQVPLTEAIRQRRRAQEAESRLTELGDRVCELERDLASAREALDASERSRRIDAALIEADAVDLETARLLTEMAVSQMDEPDVALAVEDLRRKKGFLFRRRASAAGGSSPAVFASPGRDRAVVAAREAAGSGDRAALLAYLRARRNGD